MSDAGKRLPGTMNGTYGQLRERYRSTPRHKPAQMKSPRPWSGGSAPVPRILGHTVSYIYVQDGDTALSDGDWYLQSIQYNGISVTFFIQRSDQMRLLMQLVDPSDAPGIASKR